MAPQDRTYFGIQEGPFSGKLNVGLLNPAKTEFLAGDDIVDADGELISGMDDYLSRLRHEDCTDMAIRVVAEHILKHYDGGLAIEFKDGVKYDITINRTAAEESA